MLHVGKYPLFLFYSSYHSEIHLFLSCLPVQEDQFLLWSFYPMKIISGTDQYCLLYNIPWNGTSVAVPTNNKSTRKEEKRANISVGIAFIDTPHTWFMPSGGVGTDHLQYWVTGILFNDPLQKPDHLKFSHSTSDAIILHANSEERQHILNELETVSTKVQ